MRGRALLASDTRPIRIYVIGPHMMISAALSHFVAARPRIEDLGCGSIRDIEKLRSADPDSMPTLFIVDVDDTNVTPTAAILRCRSIAPEARIIVLSGRQGVEGLRACIDAGSDGYVTKQSSIEHLFTAVETVAEGGSYVDPRIAAVLLLSEARRSASDLSAREVQIVRLISDGLSNRAIGAMLDVSEKTVKNHISRIFSKLNVTGRAQIAAHAIRSGLA